MTTAAIEMVGEDDQSELGTELRSWGAARDV
jgi:hypothetical protein